MEYITKNTQSGTSILSHLVWTRTIKKAKGGRNLFDKALSMVADFEGEKKCYGYTVKYTKDGIERINNPELFNKKFQIDSAKNYLTWGKKLRDTRARSK